MATTPVTLRLAPDDHVLVARRDLPPGTRLEAEGLVTRQRVPLGHKVATARRAVGDPIVKYGQVIGFATAPIEPGDHVHVHNCGVATFERDLRPCSAVPPARAVAPAERRTFDGYRRANGKVGTRNYLGVVSSVNCSTSVARFIADAVNRGDLVGEFGHVDGVVAFVHGTGCGMDDKGDAWDVLRRTLWGYACHPNLAGVLFVGLGCEVFQLARMKSEYGVEEHELFRTFTIQESGGTRRSIERGVAALR